MCSILIFAKDDVPVHVAIPRPWLRPQRGDVIDIQEDDQFNFGRDVQGKEALGWWRVVVLKDCPKKNVVSLISSDPIPEDSEEPYRKHVFKVDLSAVEELVGNPPFNARLFITRKQLLSLTTQKPKLENPTKIG